MAASETKWKQARNSVEWIELNLEQKTALVYYAKECKEFLLKQDFDGHIRSASILESIQSYVQKWGRISIRQLKSIQNTYRRMTNDTLFVSGLESFLLRNEESYEKSMKRKAKQKKKLADADEFYDGEEN